MKFKEARTVSERRYLFDNSKESYSGRIFVVYAPEPSALTNKYVKPQIFGHILKVG